MNTKSDFHYELKREIEDVKIKHDYNDEDALLLWWLMAQNMLEEQHAHKYIVNGPRDGGLDAIFIDPDQMVVKLVQAKYRRSVVRETTDDIRNWVIKTMGYFDPNGRPIEKNRKIKEDVRSLLLQAVDLIANHGYSLLLVYLSSGKITDSVRKEINSDFASNNEYAVVLYDSDDLAALLKEWRVDLAPAVESIKIVSDVSQNISFKMEYGNYKTILLPVLTSSVAKAYDRYGERLLAQNIRGYRGEDQLANTAMLRTINEEPDKFFYYNNGLTVICKKFQATTDDGTVVSMEKPFIINGGQTTRTLHKHYHGNKKSDSLIEAHVMLKVIEVGSVEEEEYDFVKGIILGTNRQTAIKAYELRSNDRRQVKLWRDMKLYNYAYIRKAMDPPSMREIAQGKKIVKYKDVAEAVMACEREPWDSSIGYDAVAEEEYEKIFLDEPVEWYLNRWSVYQLAQDAIREKKKEVKGTDLSVTSTLKWITTRTLWKELYKSRVLQLIGTILFNKIDRRHRDARKAVVSVAKILVSHYVASYQRSGEKENPSTFYRSKSSCQTMAKLPVSVRTELKSEMNNLRAILK